MEGSNPPSFFTKKGWTGMLMDRAMRDEQFKTQLFRFVDVLPALSSSSEISRHLQEYLDGEQVELAAGLRAGLTVAAGVPWALSSAIKTQVAGLARQFILDADEGRMEAVLRKLHDRGIAFTVDLLGEAVVSEREADQYAARCLNLLDRLFRRLGAWPGPCAGNLSARGAVPALNLSVKISALYSQIHPADPETALEKISARLRPILRRAAESGAFVNFDMESYALKDLTRRLFKTIFSESEFVHAPACGLALQAYLKESQADLADIVAWARSQRRRMTVRLVKGAYWDSEMVTAQQRNWAPPVFNLKAETDANFETLSAMLLEEADWVDAAFGTHNVRSIAHVLAQAERRGIDWRNFEFQMLHGMAQPLKSALLQLNCRLREYCPVGDLLPGMAYLVRRLLENTSDQGILASQFARGKPHEELLKNPRAPTIEGLPLTAKDFPQSNPALPRPTRFGVRRPKDGENAGLHTTGPSLRQSAETMGDFQNEPPADFTRDSERQQLREGLRQMRRQLGRRYPLLINHQPVSPPEWLPSLNPANQEEIIGYAAQATMVEAEAALAAARAAQAKWSQTPLNERATLLEKTASLMRSEKAALCALEILEAGKNWTEADADVSEAIDYCNFYAAQMRTVGQPESTQSVAGESNILEWRPRGTGVIVAPWNFPLAILTGMAMAAMVAGNTVIIKPSDQTPVIASRLMELLVKAGLPPGVANLLTGPGGTVGDRLVAHPNVDFIAFTGSKEVGLNIWETAGRTRSNQANLKKVVCEMGGKNAVIVDNDADLDEAVSGCIASAFGYQGQKCSALSRLIILADNYSAFLERFIAAADSMRIGPAEIPGNFLGPVISREAQRRLLATIEAGKKEATLAWQGRVPDDPQACYVPPVIFTEVAPECTLFREEIFGPVLAVTKARDFNEAVTLANTGEFALTAGCYSRSPVHIERAKRELICGNLYLNRGITGAVVERQPFGGFRMSGSGTKAGGRDYLKNFLVPRVVTENRLRHGFVPTDP